MLLELQGPYDLPLCLRAAAGFSREAPGNSRVLRLAVRLDGNPVLLEATQRSKRPNVIEATVIKGRPNERLKETLAWVLLADLDLRPFYKITTKNHVLAPVAKQLYGLKPFRPASLFEMAVIAIIEQQISLAAAHRIRSRLVERFGDNLEGTPMFPEAATLASASKEHMRACGLSVRKSEYIIDFSRKVDGGMFDLSRLSLLSDDDARAAIRELRGFGPWSAEYILIRGLGRPDAVPCDDLAVRSVLGRYFGDGSRMSPEQVRDALEPFSPYRGLAMFYLLVHDRIA